MYKDILIISAGQRPDDTPKNGGASQNSLDVKCSGYHLDIEN
jgi:hypothetical protein